MIRRIAKAFLLSLIGVLGCTYNLDTPAMNDLRERQRALEAQQTATSAQMADVERRQAENDAKIRMMWNRGK